MHSVSRCASRPTSVRVWRQKPVICSLQALEIIISLGVTRAMHRQQGLCQAANIVSVFNIFVFTLHFAVSFIRIQSIVLHIFVLFLPVFVFFRAIQLKCTRGRFVLILLPLLLLVRSISPTFAPFCTFSSIWMRFRLSSNESQIGILLRCKFKGVFVQVAISSPKINVQIVWRR